MLAAGTNIVTTGTDLLARGVRLGPERLARIQRACERGGSSIWASGSDPGFITETLPFALLSLQRRVDLIEIEEYGDLSHRPSPHMVMVQMRFGKPMDEFDPAAARRTCSASTSPRSPCHGPRPDENRRPVRRRRRDVLHDEPARPPRFHPGPPHEHEVRGPRRRTRPRRGHRAPDGARHHRLPVVREHRASVRNRFSLFSSRTEAALHRRRPPDWGAGAPYRRRRDPLPRSGPLPGVHRGSAPRPRATAVLRMRSGHAAPCWIRCACLNRPGWRGGSGRRRFTR
jgi:hypothetical protein